MKIKDLLSEEIALLKEVSRRISDMERRIARLEHSVQDTSENLGKTLKHHSEKIEQFQEDENNRLEQLGERLKGIEAITVDARDKVYRGDWEIHQNIKQYLYQKAGMETAEFVIKNMEKVPAFNVTLDILTYGLKQTKLDGLYLEFGVYSGKTINHIARLRRNQTIYGFDSFEGLPEDWRSGFEKGTFKVDNLPEVEQNVQLVKGWYNETLPVFLEEHTEPCAFLHIDCDLYSSTKCIFDYLEDRILPGTIIVFDEYFNYPGWQEGEHKAFMELIEETGLQFEYIGYVEIMEQVAVRII